MFVPAARVRTPELMELPGADRREHEHTLTAIGRTNLIGRISPLIWSAIRRVALPRANRPIRVLDLGCGGGQVAIALAKRLARAGISADILGCDVSPVALDYARALAARSRVTDVHFVQIDLARDPWPADFDVVYCSLFLHHLDDDEAVAMLRQMKEVAGQLVIVSDLRRTDAGYLFAWMGCRLLSRSRMFHVDGPRSVEAAFTTGEVQVLAHRAGLHGADIRHSWPQRFLLTWAHDTL
jgi:2-polyprenyl-3-methyl-5-hydroxy-6-metoxy-1,4-benzoquinol methylase